MQAGYFSTSSASLQFQQAIDRAAAAEMLSSAPREIEEEEEKMKNKADALPTLENFPFFLLLSFLYSLYNLNLHIRLFYIIESCAL